MNFIKPAAGSKVPMMCLKCKTRFTGDYPGFSYKTLTWYGGNKCPKCGCKKVVVDPMVQFILL